MTLDDVATECWKSLPPIRKRLVGKATVRDFVQLAVANWEGEYLAACADNDARKVYVAAMLGHVKREHQFASGYSEQEYGTVWVWILQAVASAVIQWLVAWWLERRAHRALMAVWKHELTS